MYKKYKNIYFIVCVLCNLLAGNLILIYMMPEMPVIFRVLLSIMISSVLTKTFDKLSLSQKSSTGIKKLGGIGCALFGQCLACTFMGMTDSYGSQLEGALKGALPLFILSAVFVPLWLVFALVNVICLYLAEKNRLKHL